MNITFTTGADLYLGAVIMPKKPCTSSEFIVLVALVVVLDLVDWVFVIY